MTVDDLLDIIKDDILDTSFSDYLLERLVNRAIKATSSRVLLPALETSDTADTVVGSSYVDLPDTFGHNLFHASTDDGPVQVLSSMRLMLNKYPHLGVVDKTGGINHCCLSGTRLAIHPVPQEITQVTLFFHQWPASLTGSQDVGVYIPGEDHQEDIVVNYVLWRLHKKIEDGLEGAMSNTLYHEKRFYDAVAAFSKTIRQGQSRPSPDRSSWEI